MPGPNDPILVNISEMIDLAIGTPECGVVDFNMLQTVLHCLAQQMRILGKNVELRGSAANLPVGRDNLQTIIVSEYEYEIDAAKTKDAEKPVIKITTEAPTKIEEPDTILIVQRYKKSEPTGGTQDYSPVGRTVTTATTAGPGGPGGPGGTAGSAGIVAAPGAASGAAPGGGAGGSEPGTESGAPGSTAGQPGARPQISAEKLSLVTISKFNMLENTVADLRNRVYGSIPKNDQILEEVRSQTNMKAISDMWTSLNVSSRLEAAEEGIAKLSSLVQDLIAETTGLQDSLSRFPSMAEAEGQGQSVKQTSEAAVDGAPSAGRPSTPAAPSSGVRPSSGAKSTAGRSGMSLGAKSGDVNVKKQLDKVRGDLDQLSQAFHKAMEDIYGEPYTLPAAGSEGTATGEQGTATGEAGTARGGAGGASGQSETPGAAPGTPGAAAPDGTPGSAPGTPGGSAAGGPGGTGTAAGAAGAGGKAIQRPIIMRGAGAGGMPTEVLTRINELEKKLNQCCETIGKSDGIAQDQINSFQDQLEALMRQVSKLTEDLSAGKLSPDLIKDLQGLMELFSTVQEMQAQLKEVHETALQLAAEKENRQHNINALLEQIELLKTVKLDREDMIEAMAEKADLRMLARKVSHDQFELACDDLSRGVEHALGKLNLQESLWQQALDDIQREIETKLDKMELSPVKDFFNSKLRQLQENLKQMASLRREAEAAGTKRKLLRDVKCISCDAKAVMPVEAPSTIPVSRPLTANFSMKPYLSYELDAIRKSQQANMPQRNMHDWEAIDKQMGPKPPPKAKSEGEKHLCNRYCGGSHTTTTPAQRVARLGHFIKQWGPDVLPLSSGLAAGDDGRLYKVTTTEGANVGPGGIDTTCTPKPPKEAPDKPRTPPKQMVISAECRCLDSGSGK